MSSVHGSPHWSPTAFEAEVKFKSRSTLGGWEIQSPTKISEKMRLFGELTHRIIETVADTANRTIKGPSCEEPARCFVVNPEKNLAETISTAQKMARLIKKPLPVQEVCQLVREYVELRRGTGRLMFYTDQEVFNTNRFIFSYGMTKKQVSQWQEDISIDALFYVCKSLKHKSLGVYQFSQEDKDFLANPSVEVLERASQISCSTYALLKKREPTIIKEIVNDRESDLSIDALIRLIRRSLRGF